MQVPLWLTLCVAFLVCAFGAYRIRLSFRSDEDDQRARARRGLFGLGRRTHFLVGVIYILLGAGLVATSFGWNPFAGFVGARRIVPATVPVTVPAPTSGSAVTGSAAPGSAATGSAAPAAPDRP